MYILDTDILIWVLRGNEAFKKFVSRLKTEGPLGISVVSVAEIYKNIYPSELSIVEKYLHSHVLINVNQEIAKQAGFYWQQYSKNLKNLSLTDCLIAATANINEATLVSLNVRHFPMKDIKFMNPSD